MKEKVLELVVGDNYIQLRSGQELYFYWNKGVHPHLNLITLDQVVESLSRFIRAFLEVKE